MTVLEKIRPADQPSPTTWELGALDRAMLPMVLRGTWLFDRHLDAERLKTGLARVLSHYPHLAGRMERGRRVHLRGAGVPLCIKEEPEQTVAGVCQLGGDVDRYSVPITKRRMKKGREPVLTAQITRLKDGTVIGLRCSHACADGASFYGLAKNWGRASAGKPLDPEPLVDQAAGPKSTGRSKEETIAKAKALGWEKLRVSSLLGILIPYMTGTMLHRTPPFHFSQAALESLQADLSRKSGCDLTKNEALSAHFTALLCALHGHNEGTPCSQVTIVDGRRRLAAVPQSFVGNLSFGAVTAELPSGSSAADFAAQIHKRLRPFVATPSAPYAEQMGLALDALDHGLLWMPFDFCDMHSRRPPLTYINNFTRQPIYDVDFGDEKGPTVPVRVVPHNLPDPVLLWPAPPEVGGIEVYLSGVACRAALKKGQRSDWWKRVTEV